MSDMRRSNDVMSFQNQESNIWALSIENYWNSIGISAVYSWRLKTYGLWRHKKSVLKISEKARERSAENYYVKEDYLGISKRIAVV